MCWMIDWLIATWLFRYFENGKSQQSRLFKNVYAAIYSHLISSRSLKLIFFIQFIQSTDLRPTTENICKVPNQHGHVRCQQYGSRAQVLSSDHSDALVWDRTRQASISTWKTFYLVLERSADGRACCTVRFVHFRCNIFDLRCGPSRHWHIEEDNRSQKSEFDQQFRLPSMRGATHRKGREEASDDDRLWAEQTRRRQTK